MKAVTVQELKGALDSSTDIQLIDVREMQEHGLSNIGGELIPMGSIPQNIDRIQKDKPVIFYCRSGARSGNVIQWLERNYGFENLYNLQGGMQAWKREIDNSINVA